VARPLCRVLENCGKRSAEGPNDNAKDRVLFADTKQRPRGTHFAKARNVTLIQLTKFTYVQPGVHFHFHHDESAGLEPAQLSIL